MKDIRVTDLPPEKMQERLRRKDGYTTITLGGEKREFFMGGIAYDIAEEEGVDLASVLDALDEAERLDEDQLTPEKGNEMTTALTWMFYIGMAPFEEDLTPAEVKLEVSSLGEEEVEQLMEETGLAPESPGESTAGKKPQSPATDSD